jgi:hypothetical protein
MRKFEGLGASGQAGTEEPRMDTDGHGWGEDKIELIRRWFRLFAVGLVGVIHRLTQTGADFSEGLSFAVTTSVSFRVHPWFLASHF